MPDFKMIFEKHRLPCMEIKVEEGLNETESNMKRQIIMEEARERAKIKNPKLYEFVYGTQSNITIPTHLHFGQIPSYIENVEYKTRIDVKVDASRNLMERRAKF